ncbi:MAG: hypothetical protein K1X51_14195 [Rhodospirillaceae bacterium]|nr:hypothetical protein [Rhodospirillaceae bacterium]
MERGSEIEHALKEARAGLAVQNFGLAEFYARNVLDLDPVHPDALALVGRIAVQFGIRDQAVSTLAAAHSIRAEPEIAALLQQAAALPMVEGRPNSLLVIKAWHAGFWAEVSHVLGALLLADLTGRTPVTLWGSNCLYNDGSTPDAFQLYFEGVSDVTAPDLVTLGGGDFFPAKWNEGNLFQGDHAKFKGEGARLPAFQFLARKERIAVVDYHVGIPDLLGWIPSGHRLHGLPVEKIYRDLIDKYLRPTRAVMDQIDLMEALLNLSEVELAIHIRGSDKALEVSNLAKINAYYLEVLSKIHRGGRILLLTEDERLIPLFREKYGDRVVVPPGERQSNGVPPHFRTGLNRVKVGMEAARDAYLASRTKKFLGNGRSNFSAMIPLLMAPSSESYLIRKNLLYERNGFKFGMTGA